jgi:hypothetical protein
MSSSASSAVDISQSLPPIETYNLFASCSVKKEEACNNLASFSCQVSLIVTPEYSVDSYNSSRFCRRSVKQDGKKSGKTLWMAPNTKTWPIGDSGMSKMMTTGMNVIVSLNVRL